MYVSQSSPPPSLAPLLRAFLLLPSSTSAELTSLPSNQNSLNGLLPPFRRRLQASPGARSFPLASLGSYQSEKLDFGQATGEWREGSSFGCRSCAGDG